MNKIKYDGETLSFKRAKYLNNGNTFIGAVTDKGEYYCDVSINLDKVLKENEIVINHNIQNTCPELVKLFKKEFCVDKINEEVSYGWCTSEIVTLKDINMFDE